MWCRALLLIALSICIGGPGTARAEAPALTAQSASARRVGAFSPFAPGEHPGALPWGTSHTGVSWVNGVDALESPVVESSGILRASRWQVGFVLGHAPWSLHSHTRIENGYRLWGAVAQRAVSPLGASHATLSMSFDNARYTATSTSTTSLELRLSSRTDLKLVLPELRSLFVEGELGFVGRRSAQRTSSAAADIKYPQYGLGLGYYFGDPSSHGSELRVRYAREFKSYCQLQPVVPALRLPRGCVGFELIHFVSPTWGVRAQTELGHGWVLGLYLVARAWSESAESNGLFDFGQ